MSKRELWRSHSLCAVTSFGFGLMVIGIWVVVWLNTGRIYFSSGSARHMIIPLALGIAGLDETRGGYKRGRWMALAGTLIGAVGVALSICCRHDYGRPY